MSYAAGLLVKHDTCWRRNLSERQLLRLVQVLTEAASQVDVYHAAVQPIVEDVLNGYNGTIMAYGQTGAGKTYTLSSRDPNAIGMMPRAAAAIFSAIEHDQSHSYTVMMSYIQLYMELLQVSPRDQPSTCAQMPLLVSLGSVVLALTCEFSLQTVKIRKIVGNASTPGFGKV